MTEVSRDARGAAGSRQRRARAHARGHPRAVARAAVPGAGGGRGPASSAPASRPRRAGERLAASYVNFYPATGRVVFPLLDERYDEQAAEILRACFPGREVVGIPSREILLGGGNIHCITQQVPASRTERPAAPDARRSSRSSASAAPRAVRGGACQSSSTRPRVSSRAPGSLIAERAARQREVAQAAAVDALGVRGSGGPRPREALPQRLGPAASAPAARSPAARGSRAGPPPTRARRRTSCPAARGSPGARSTRPISASAGRCSNQ